MFLFRSLGFAVSLFLAADGVTNLDSSLTPQEMPPAEVAGIDAGFEAEEAFKLSGAFVPPPVAASPGNPGFDTIKDEEEEEEEEGGAPVISDFSVAVASLGGWTVSGFVTDPEDDMEGCIVVFSGVLDGYTAEVQSDGSFTLTDLFPNMTDGDAYAITSDPHGVPSNQPSFYVDI